MKCKICGRSAQSEYCFQHKPRKALKKTAKTTLNWTVRPNAAKAFDKAYEMHLFFQDIWKKRPHRSEVSGDYLGKEALSTYFHHIMPKSKYPELRLNEDNIILLTLEEHDNVENNMYRYDEVNKRREKLKKEFDL